MSKLGSIEILYDSPCNSSVGSVDGGSGTFGSYHSEEDLITTDGHVWTQEEFTSLLQEGLSEDQLPSFTRHNDNINLQ